MRKVFQRFFKKSPSTPVPVEPPSIPSCEISPMEVKQRLDAGEPIILVDIRSQEEHEIIAFPHGIHIPRVDIHDRYHEISDDPSAEIIVVCHHGIESEQVMHQLWGLGYQNARFMPGGIDAWSVEIDPSLPRY